MGLIVYCVYVYFVVTTLISFPFFQTFFLFPSTPLPVNTILLSYIFLAILYVSFWTKNHKGWRGEVDNTSLPIVKKSDSASDDLQQQSLDDPRLVSNGVPASIHFGVNGQRIFEDRLDFSTVN